jgi:hypothetical protein
MKNPHKTGGQWIGLFYLTLSDISAEINAFQLKRKGGIDIITGRIDNIYKFDMI